MYDVFGIVKKMRQARRGMVETVDQYIFIYECLEEAFLSGKTWFPVNELSNQMKYKSVKSPITRVNEYQREFEKICKMTPKLTIGDCAGGYRVENRDKNRDQGTVPPDNHRPYLSTFQSNDSTDYVNGVFVDGYTRSREYLVTEWPMQHTVPDIWALIYDHNCNSVIVLGNPAESNDYPSFWPTEKEKRRKFGPVFTIDCISFNHYANIKSWILRINKKVVSLTELMSGVKGTPKTTQVFQITCWPQGQGVPSSTNALVELMNMVERWRQRSLKTQTDKNKFGHVCVVSTNGKSRAGVYCAANVAIEQVVQHGEVDVFQAVKTVRRHRHQLVENMTEYKYCYDLLLHYVLHYLNQG
jgi:protein tyrosine phosphatase